MSPAAELRSQPSSARAWLLSLLLVGAVLRLGFWMVYAPQPYPDTDTYVTTARYFTTGDYTGYEGRRTPGYPLLIALGGFSPSGVWALQMLCGLGISALLFYVALQATGRPGFAWLIGMTYNLNLAQLFFEANLLSETLTTLTLAATVAALALSVNRMRAGRPVLGPALLLGALGGVVALVRPQFVYLPLLLAAILGYASLVAGRARIWPSALRAVAVAVPGLVLVLGWCAFNYARIGYFQVTTQFGIGLMAQSLPFVEDAPERYALIRDIYIKHRNAKIAETGRHNAEWDAIPELKKKTGLGLPALSKELERMSIGLFLRHPVGYGIGVARAWVDFWLAPNYWRPEQLRPEPVGTAARLIWRVEHPLVRLSNAVFLVLTAGVAISAGLRRRVAWDVTLTGIVAIVLTGSIVPAFSFWGENARYAIPVQALVIAVVLIAAERLVSRRAAAFDPLGPDRPQPVMVERSH